MKWFMNGLQKNWQITLVIIAIFTSAFPVWQRLNTITELVEYAPKQELQVIAEDLVGLSKVQLEASIRNQYERKLLKSTYLLNICTSNHVMFTQIDLAKRIGHDEAEVACHFRRMLQNKTVTMQ